MKPIKIDFYTEKCAKCGELVTYAKGTGVFYQGASESYEGWETVEHQYCPRCGEKVERMKKNDH